MTKYQNGLGIDNKLKMTTGGVSKYFVADHLGSTNALTDSSGTILEQTLYDSFGNATNQLATRYAFTGREYDTFNGLHYYRARRYDSNVGRFISEDPIGFAGGDVNLYGYVWNSPIKLVDPLGTDGGATIVLGGGALIGGGGGALGAAVVAAAPPVAIVVGGGLLIYGAWELGEYIARRRYPDQLPETQTKPETCNTKPKANPPPPLQPVPQPLPTPSSTPGDKSQCPPCRTTSGKIVAIGTVAYRPLDIQPGHGVSGPHHNLFVCNQAPANSPMPCKCFWQKIHAVPPPPPQGSIPMEPFAP